jgi:hypothetical protein
MRKVENIEDAEDQRQPDRHDEQPGRVDQSIDENCRRDVHAPSLRKEAAEASHASAPAIC